MKTGHLIPVLHCVAALSAGAVSAVLAGCKAVTVELEAARLLAVAPLLPAVTAQRSFSHLQ